METKTFNIVLATKAQENYTEHSPLFAPSDGVCWKCNKQIYSEGGISVEKASSELVTGCPFCHRSFVD